MRGRGESQPTATGAESAKRQTGKRIKRDQSITKG